MTENDPIQKEMELASPAQKKERTWATFCHLSSLLIFIGIPFGNIFGPLILWLIKKDEMPLVDEEGKSVLNFQISVTMYALLAGILCLLFIGYIILPIIIIADVILVVMAVVKTSNGGKFRYPCAIALIK